MTTNIDTESTSDNLAPRGAFGLVVDRLFGAIFWGKLLSSVGVWIHSIVAAIVVYAATGSALWVGLVSVAQFGPQIFLSPISGKWADSGNLARQLVLGRVLCFVGSASIATLCFVSGTPDGYDGALAVLAASLVTGLGFVVGGPAQQSIIPILIRSGELSTAMALNSLPMTLARVVGPAVGALIAAHYSPALAFSIAAFTHAVFVGLLMMTDLPAGGSPVNTDLSVRAGLKHIWSDRTLLVLLLVVAAVGFASEPSMTLAPTIADKLSGGTRLVGELTTAFGIGAGLGFVIFGMLSRRVSQARLVQCGLAAMAAGLILVAFGADQLVVLGSFMIVGLGFMLAMTSATTLIQQRVPGHLRGRIMALWMVGFVGSRPLAAAMQGFLADALSLRVALLTTAGLVAVALIVWHPRRLLPD